MNDYELVSGLIDALTYVIPILLGIVLLVIGLRRKRKGKGSAALVGLGGALLVVFGLGAVGRALTLASQSTSAPTVLVQSPLQPIPPSPFLDTANDNKNAHSVREYVFVEVSTDEGVTGWGEITGTSAVSNRAVCAGLRHVSGLIEGDDPRLIEMIWNKIFRSFTYMGSRGATTHMISGIDIALWDIRGKMLGLPISELFGGPVREGVPIYCLPTTRAEVTVTPSSSFGGPSRLSPLASALGCPSSSLSTRSPRKRKLIMWPAPSLAREVG